MSNWAIMQGDVLDMLRFLPDNTADLILTDPPYYKVKDEDWDHQWATPVDYLAWLDGVAAEWQRVLKPNGSLYVFAWPEMSARIEVMLSKRFNVLNNLVWYKTTGNRNWSMDKDVARSFLPNTERIVFAEQRDSDIAADEEAGYTVQCEAAKRAVFGDYLSAAAKLAGVSGRQIIEEIGAYGKVNHGGAWSNWLIGYNCPTAEQYQKMRNYLNSLDRGKHLDAEYEYLKSEYEDLRREYEELRRPFDVTANEQFTDVWNFRPVASYDGKHPAEKPQALLRHIVKVSSKPDALVLDTFAGSGSTGKAAIAQGRRFIGIEASEHWAAYAERNIADGVQLSLLDGIAA